MGVVAAVSTYFSLQVSCQFQVLLEQIWKTKKKIKNSEDSFQVYMASYCGQLLLLGCGLM